MDEISDLLKGMIRKNINSVETSEVVRLWRRKPRQTAIEDYLHSCEMSHHLWERVSARVARALDQTSDADAREALLEQAREYHTERFVQRYREPPCDLILKGKVTAAQAKVLQELLGLEGNVVQIYRQLNSEERGPLGQGLLPERYQPLVKRLKVAEIAYELVPIEGA